MHKQYYKDIEGIRHWYDGVIRTKDKQIFTWDEELILTDGWIEYKPEPHIPTLEEVKRQKISEIESYDASVAVNEFFLGNQSMWLDKATRVGLMLRFQAEEAQGKTTTVLWYGLESVELPIVNAKAMLNALELYASDCYDNTASHKHSVMSLETIEEVEGYDYTTGYPEKLSFEYN